MTKVKLSVLGEKSRWSGVEGLPPCHGISGNRIGNGRASAEILRTMSNGTSEKGFTGFKTESRKRNGSLMKPLERHESIAETNVAGEGEF
jgi:hypothetical protein